MLCGGRSFLSRAPDTVDGLFVTFTLAETLRPSGSAVKWLLRSGGVTDRCGYAEASAFPDPHYKGKKEI